MQSDFPVPRSFADAIAQHLWIIAQLELHLQLLEHIADRLTAALAAGNKVAWCGNGGSAADSQHLAAELVGRFRRERRGLSAMALTTDTSILSCVMRSSVRFAALAS